MEKKKQSKLPKDFFKQPRPIITMKEAIKDSNPFEWSKETLEGRKKPSIVSAKKIVSL